MLSLPLVWREVIVALENATHIGSIAESALHGNLILGEFGGEQQMLCMGQTMFVEILREGLAERFLHHAGEIGSVGGQGLEHILSAIAWLEIDAVFFDKMADLSTDLRLMPDVAMDIMHGVALLGLDRMQVEVEGDEQVNGGQQQQQSSIVIE